MALSIQGLNNLRDCLPKKLLPAMNNSLVISHLQYPAVLWSTIDNLIVTLEKQLSWAVKACCHRLKFESQTDIELQEKKLPARVLLDYGLNCYRFYLITNRKPAFNKQNRISLPTFNCYKHQRSGKFSHQTDRSKHYDKRLIRRVLEEFLNKLPKIFYPAHVITPLLKQILKLFFFLQFVANY